MSFLIEQAYLCWPVCLCLNVCVYVHVNLCVFLPRQGRAEILYFTIQCLCDVRVIISGFCWKRKFSHFAYILEKGKQKLTRRHFSRMPTAYLSDSMSYSEQV